MGPGVVHETRDTALLERLLRREPVWGGYALADLDEPLFARTRWFLSDPGGEALALLFRAGEETALHTFGQPAAVAGLLAPAAGLPLPARFHVHAPLPHAAAIAAACAGEWVPSLRMALSPGALEVPPLPSGVTAGPLTPADVSAARAVYAHYPDNWFDPARLETWPYLGARAGEELVAIAGTHVASRRQRVAAVGDVVTLPAWRGRGLAAALTARVCRAHLEGGVERVVLNVAEANLPARRAYERIGFGAAVPYLEGAARRIGG